ncbi:MAG: hypothetical protein GY757_33610, partial [bacterium]|nr:hypothetical protein [bacterium]
MSVETGKQLYAPGETINAVFTGSQTGTLTAEAFGESYTQAITTSASMSFQVPQETIGGTYGISWEFQPVETAKSDISGIHSFDVSGLVVKVARSGMDKAKYSPGENLNAAFTLESNRDETLELRCWTVTPQNNWTYLGESQVTLSASSQVKTPVAYDFTTTEAGTHGFVYDLYRGDTLVVGGRMNFYAGEAQLTNITTEHSEYKEGNGDVAVNIGHFGEGNVQLELFMDEEKVDEKSVMLNGMGTSETVLTASTVSGGSHTLRAVLTKDNLTSTKITSFTYGTHLPNLMLSSADTQIDGFNYTYNLTVTNTG